MARYLIDTCVWRDFYEDRISYSGKKLGKTANKFFLRIIKNNDEIIFSEFLINELKTQYPEEEIFDLLNIFIMNCLLKKINTTKEEIIYAKKLSRDRKLPFVDCLNAVQARNHEAIVITQDRHFQRLSDIVKIESP